MVGGENTHEAPIPIDRFEVEADGERLAAFRTTPFRSDAPTAVILHGAGEATKERSLPLAGALARQGLNAVSFDFAGHGESTGRTEQMTLARRAVQAHAVIDGLPDTAALAICGFSMSGQTSCDLLARGIDPAVVALFAPAIYGADAQQLRFGPDFSAAIRKPKAWRTSPALDAIRAFEGALVIYTSAKDDVIPDEVPELLVREAAKAVVAEHVFVAGAPHQLSQWLGENPSQAALIAQRIETLSRRRVQGETTA